MKWMIASDLHGSAYYCKKLWEAYEREGADKMLFLGDLLYHGPRNDLPKDYAPKKVIEMFNAHKADVLCVRGNCEAEVDQMVLEFPVLANYAYLEIEGKRIFATHGHLYGENPPLKAGEILLQGHTHIPRHEEKDGILFLNPGSLSIPKDGSMHSYIIYENRQFIWKDIDSVPYLSLDI